jgi:hypothetical protein
MNYEITQAVQAAITPGEHFDNFYCSEECTKKAAYSTLVDNRFTVALNSKSAGSTSVVNFNPDQGMSDIVLTLQLPVADSTNTYTNAGVDAGWGYRAIKQLGIRIGGSSLYYWSGRQLAVEIMDACEDSVKRDALFGLGGRASDDCATDYAAATADNVANRTAYVYIKCPWNSPSQQEKPVPLPTDLLTQPIQLLVELAPMSEVFSSAGGTVSGLPTGYETAEMCFRQIHMQDASMLLARRENMNEKAYSLPLKYFSQTAFQAPVPAVADNGQPIQINLTGFRSGQIDDMLLFLVKNTDLAGGHGLLFQPMSNVRVLVNGLVYYDSRVGSSDIWSLVDRKTTASFNLVQNNNGTLVTPVSSPYVVVPFAQKFDILTGEASVESGFPIMNSIVNLSFTVPAASTDYTLFAVYRYNSNLLFSKGSCEYVF